MVRSLYQIGAIAIIKANLICRYLRKLENEYISCLFSKNTITISRWFLFLAITNNKKQDELMVRSLHQIWAFAVIKA